MAFFTHLRLLLCLRMGLEVLLLVFNGHPKYELWNKVDNTTGPLRVCVLNEAFDASLHLYLVSKVQTLSVIKQPDSKCFREAPIVSFHLTRCSFVMMALVHLALHAVYCA